MVDNENQNAPERAATYQMDALINGVQVRATKEEQPRPFYTYQDLLEMKVEEVPTLFGDLILTSGIGVLYGAPDCGKSMLLRQMCMCVADGRSFLGWEYHGTRHKAIYFSSEDDANITAPVIKRNNKTMQLSKASAKNLRFVFGFEADKLATQVEQMLTEEPADLVVIDAFGDAFQGKSTNDTTEVRKFYAPFKDMAQRHEMLILFNHHIGKYAERNIPGRETALGSEAVVSAPRLAIELRRDPNNPDIKHLCIVKANYLPTSEKSSSHALQMDENLVFAATGDHVEFEALAKKDERAKGDKRDTKPTDFTADQHRNFLRGIFDGKEQNQTFLRTHIMKEFEVSDVTARKFIDFYLSYKMMREAGKSGRSILYKCLVK